MRALSAGPICSRSRCPHSPGKSHASWARSSEAAKRQRTSPKIQTNRTTRTKTRERLRKVKLEPAHLPHHWLNGTELKLRIYSETADGPFASFDLVVETKSSEEGDPAYTGAYRLQIYRAEAPAGSDEQQVIRTGTAECSVG